MNGLVQLVVNCWFRHLHWIIWCGARDVIRWSNQWSHKRHVSDVHIWKGVHYSFFSCRNVLMVCISIGSDWWHSTSSVHLRLLCLWVHAGKSFRIHQANLYLLTLKILNLPLLFARSLGRNSKLALGVADIGGHTNSLEFLGAAAVSVVTRGTFGVA